MKLPTNWILAVNGSWSSTVCRLQKKIWHQQTCCGNRGQYRGANNRAYYSIYHTIDAVLSAEGVAFKRHKDTLAYFNKNYVASEIFPRTMGRRIVQAEEIRHSSDYDPFYIASKRRDTETD